METKQNLFAFKLASKEAKREDAPAQDKWKAREGEAVAGCTEYRFEGNYRYGTTTSKDGGVYC